MAIIVKDSFEPLSDRSLKPDALSPLLVRSDATRVLGQELLRYCDGYVTGRSFLIAGHRGAGKSTLVAKAFLDVWTKADRGAPILRPLLIALHGPSLLPAPEHMPQTPAAAPAEGSASKAGLKAAVGKTKKEKEPASQAEEGSSAKSDEAKRKPAPAAKVKPDAQVALEQITLGLHRAVTREFAKRYYDRVTHLVHLRRQVTSDRQSAEPTELDRMLQDLPPNDEMYQTAAQFEIELYEAPPAQRLTAFYRRIDALSSGVLFSGPPPATEPEEHEQGARELVALASVIDAYRRISGDYTRSDSRKDALQQKREQTFSAGGDLKNVVAPLAALLTGTVAGAGLAASGTSAPGALIGGILAAVAASLVLKISSERKHDQTVTRDYQFVFDLSVSTLDRILPILIERLRLAGLAPVFVVDELDKVKGLGTRMLAMVHHLKKLVAENAFFCFLTDRSYYEEIVATSDQHAYSVEYTYFGQRLFVVFSPEDFERYMREQIPDPEGPTQPASGQSGTQTASDPVLTAERTACAIVRWAIRHRSQLHVLDLQRQITALRDDSGKVTLDPEELASSRRNRIDATFQVGIELRLGQPEIQQLTAERPEFRRLLHDAMYYMTREWLKGRPDVDLSWDTGHKKFVDYLELRAERDNRPAPQQPPSSRGSTTKPSTEPARPFDVESVFLFNHVRELADFLSDRPSPDGAPVPATATTPAVTPPDWRREFLTQWNQDRSRRKLPELEASVSNVLLVGQKGAVLTRGPKPGVYVFGYPLGGSQPAHATLAGPPVASVVTTPVNPSQVASPLSSDGATPPDVTPEQSEPKDAQAPRTRRTEAPSSPIGTIVADPLLDPGAWQAQGAFIRVFARAVLDMQVEPIVSAPSAVALHGSEMVSLASLQSRFCVIPQTPSWGIVEKALARLEESAKRGSMHPTYTEDAFNVDKLYDVLTRNAGLVAGTMLCGNIVGLPSGLIERHKRIERGLEIVSQAYDLERLDEAGVHAKIENLAAQIRSAFEEGIDTSLLLKEIRSIDELEALTSEIRHTMQEETEATRARLTSIPYDHDSWIELARRLGRWIESGEPGDPEIAEVLAAAGGGGPRQIMRFNPHRMTAADWTRLLARIRAPRNPPAAPAVPAWIGLFALQALGFYVPASMQDRVLIWLNISPAAPADGATRLSLEMLRAGRIFTWNDITEATLFVIRRTASQLFSTMPSRIEWVDSAIPLLVGTAEEMHHLLSPAPGGLPLSWLSISSRNVVAIEMDPEYPTKVEEILKQLKDRVPTIRIVFAYPEDHGRAMQSPRIVKPASAEEIVQAAR